MTDIDGDKVLICVDDEPIILLAMKQELRLHLKRQAAVETCASAAEALALIEDCRNRKVRIILVISDWLMPGMNGDEFMLRVHERYPDIPLVLVTGQADEREIERLKREVSIRMVLRKPWRSSDLRAVVDSVLAS